MKKQILGIIRHLLTFVGGYLVAQDWLDAELMPELIGAIMTIIGAAWSIKSPEKKS